MLRNRAGTVFVVALMTAVVIAGCGSDKAKTTTPVAPPSMAVIDMSKVIKAHPRYGEVLNLQKEAAGLAARLEAERAQGIASASPLPAMTGNGLEQTAAQEFSSRMAAREAEAKTRLEAEAEKVRQDMTAEMDAYVSEVDKDYQPQLFNIQLKMKTVQLSKEEAAALQAEADKIRKERAAKLGARQQALVGKMDSIMKGKQADAERELEAYARSLNSELSGKIATKQAEISGRIAGPANNAESAAVQDKLMTLERDIADLQELIVNDIRDKAAKVAAERKIETVLTEVRVNISAVDITDAVIAEFKK